jgi:hypothetical protein
LAYWYDVVYLCCWVTAIDACVVVSVEYVLPGSLPSWWVVLVAFASDPCRFFVFKAVCFWAVYCFGAA